MVRTIKKGFAVALLLGVGAVAHAAGLGKLTVNSALGQTLDAEIDLVSVQPGELEVLQARVAAPEAFRDARIEYSGALRLLRFSVDKRPNGQPFLKVTSVAPINEPFIDALIEVTWPAGRIQREYPILLDPPGFSSSRVAPQGASPAPAPLAVTSPPAATPAAAPSTPPSAAVTPSAPIASGSPSARTELARPDPAVSGKPAGETYGPVQKGDTLNKIASETKPDGVSMEQMLVALYRENQGAFAGNNMNRLKTGQILKVPKVEEASRIEQKEANKEIRTQVADWKSYRDSLAGGVASIPARPESSSAASGRVASAAVPAPAPAPSDSKDVLKLSKSDAGKSGSGKGEARVNALQEEVIAKDKALKESQSRVTELEKQIRDMQRLLDLKGSAPAKAEPPKAADKAPAKPEPVKVEPPKPEPPKVAEVKPEPPKVEPAKVEPPKVEAPKVEPAKPADPVVEPPKVEAKPTPPKTTTAKKAAPPPPPPSLMDELLDNPAYLAIGAGGIGALALGGFMFARRRKAKSEGGPTSSMTSAFPSDLKPNTNTGKPGGGLVDTGNSSFLTDFDKTGPGTIDTDEVDPVAEAEVYIAYGRDAQAEEILKEAMARDKGRHEIALKLLEIYHARKSATAFETVAKELHASVGDNHPLWQKAAAMGAQIDPSNNLYIAAAGGTATFTAMAAPAAAPKPDLDFDLEATSSGHAADTGSASAPAPSFDLDLDAKAPAPDLATDSSDSLDIDLAPSPSAPVEAPRDEKPAFDFDLSGLDFPGTKPAASASSGMADLSLDLASSDGDSGGGDAVGTKLELAKAYLEIGDKDGAREILMEVVKEGSGSQKGEAQKLIDSL
ncbi:hypothetical protein BWI17_19110 [Betaproteobacteria bacterium GR16-43]|nr:hypothetical protein BWI17_19110 [Betaproteobacteria bacterium GR16-43]